VKPGAKTLLAAAGIWAVTGLHAGANTAAGLDAVSVFNRICYSKVPSTEAVEKMALELGWSLLVPKDMEAFGKPDEFSYFRGWDVQVGEQFYRVGLTQRGVAGSLAEQFPAFAKGTVTSCTLVLGDEDAAQDVDGAMRELAGKEPVSSGVEEGGMLTTTWAGGNDQFKVFLFNKTSRSASGGLLTVTIVSKE